MLQKRQKETIYKELEMSMVLVFIMMLETRDNRTMISID